MTQLSERQQQVLDYVRTVVADRGYPPFGARSVRRSGCRHRRLVHSHLSVLVKAGVIRRDPPSLGRSRSSTEPRFRNRFGTTTCAKSLSSAGSLPAAPSSPPRTSKTLFSANVLVGSGPVFMLRVRGDSMVDAGILDGDLVVVRRQPDANDGDIVAAMIEGEEATVKRLYRRDGQIVLHAENPAYPDMVFDGDVAILGKVVSVLRRLR